MLKKIIFKYLLISLPFIIGLGLYICNIVNIISTLLLFIGGYIFFKNTCDYRLIKKNIQKVKKQDKLIDKQDKTINTISKKQDNSPEIISKNDAPLSNRDYKLEDYYENTNIKNNSSHFKIRKKIK